MIFFGRRWRRRRLAKNVEDDNCFDAREYLHDRLRWWWCAFKWLCTLALKSTPIGFNNICLAAWEGGRKEKTKLEAKSKRKKHTKQKNQRNRMETSREEDQSVSPKTTISPSCRARILIYKKYILSKQIINILGRQLCENKVSKNS